MALLTTTGRLTLLLITVLVLSFALTGCGAPNDPHTGIDGAYTVLSTLQTSGFAKDFDFDQDTLYVAENSLGIGAYTFNGSSILFKRHILSSHGSPRMIRTDPKSHTAAIYSASKRAHYRSFTDSTEQKPSVIDAAINDMICLVEYGSILSDYDSQEHDTYFTRLISADINGDDGLIIQTIFRDSTEYDPPDGIIDNYVYETMNKFKFRFPGDIAISSVGVVTSSANKYEHIDTLVVGLHEAGIAFANISEVYEGANIWMTGYIDTPGEVLGVTYDNGYVYAATGLSGLSIIKVNNFIDAEVVTNLDMKGLDHAEKVAVDGDRLALMDRLDGVHFLDISDPASPVYKGLYEVRNATQIRFRDGNLFLSTESSGLTVLNLDF
jgi:hypothetical protein